MNRTDQLLKVNSGFTLLEVVLAIAVFAFGLLALVQLQSGLARSGADATTRTVAVNIAEEWVENARGFTQIASIPENDPRLEYDEILSVGPTEVRMGLDPDSEFGVVYQRNVIVQEYYWDASTETFTTEAPAGIVNSDYKTIDIVVLWRERDASEGEIWEDHDSFNFAELGGGIRIIESVTSSPPTSGALVAAERQQAGGPQVVYNPGDNPDIIRITLDEDGGKFKESTTPAPDVIRDEKVETWFDVVTYSQLADDDATFLRREEFVAITCDCELDTAPAAADYGLKPTLWNGVTYSEGEKVSKPIGIPVGSAAAQSQFCGVCCRDHHDGAGGGAEDVYSLEFVGRDSDHPHYARDRRGNIIPTPVGDGDEYLEACRLVRKDGFMRVTHNANQAALLGFEHGYLNAPEGANAYAAYVTDAAAAYFGGAADPFPQPNPPDLLSPHTFPARTPEVPTYLPAPWLDPASEQQLRSRAVYTDYVTAAAQEVIDECFPIADRTADCPAPNTSTELEIYPFFDLQMTWLANWRIDPLTGLVSVSSQPIESGNTHSRGLLALTSGSAGQSHIIIESKSDNLGLTATGAIDLLHDSRSTDDTMYVNANDGGDPAPGIGHVVSGSLTSALRRVPAADLLLTPVNALCGHTDTEWTCAVIAPDAFLTIGNYYLNVPRTWACSELAFVSETAELDATTFALPGAAGTYDIWITDDFSVCERP